jgi:hypothetical protein
MKDSSCHVSTTNFPTSISSNQGDAWFDQIINSKQTFFARVTYKLKNVLAAPSGSIFAGSTQEPE